MHLLYVTSSLPFSFEEAFIAPEILEIRRRGHRVTVVPIRPRRAVLHGDARLLTDVTIARPLLSLSILGGALAEIVGAPRRALGSARWLAKSRDVRVLVKNLSVLAKGLWLARVARRQGVDHIHAHFASTNATVALVAGHHAGIPWSFTAHRWDITEDNLLETKARAARFARVIDVRGARELAGLAGPHGDKIRLIHMGVVLGPEPRPVERPRGPLRVLLAARIDGLKGHRVALQAIARLKAAGADALLHCAGDGPLRHACEREARALGLVECVQFPGWVDHQELLSQLRDRRWDVALLPSLESRASREGIPVFLIEAMAAGVPVVATRTGGIPELLDGGAGLLVPQQDAGAIAEALTRIAADDDLRRRLAVAGRRRVRDQFAIEAMASALLREIAAEQG